MFLLDTDTVIYMSKGRPQVLEKVREHTAEGLRISIVTLMELYYGAYKSQRPTVNMARVRLLETGLVILPLSPEIADVFGMQKAALEKVGTPLDDFDLAIAATALLHNLILVTNNQRHFQRIEGLRLANWVE